MQVAQRRVARAEVVELREHAGVLQARERAAGRRGQALVVDDDGLIHAAGGTTYDDSSGAAWFARLDASGATHDAASFVIGDYTRAEGVALGPGPAWYVGGEAGTYAAWVRRLDAAATVAWTWQEPDASAFALAVDPAGVRVVGRFGECLGDASTRDRARKALQDAGIHASFVRGRLFFPLRQP
mgnify:CR=1 FL=1